MSSKLLIRILLALFVIVGARAASAAEPTPEILIVGDSLSAGYGIDVQKSWPALLQRRLVDEGYVYKVVNASISGDTTAGGRARLPALLSTHKPAIVLIELGGNDGLRAQSLQQMYDNLAFMIDQAQRRQAKVLLAGMRLPPNYGLAYTEKFQQVYRELARRYTVELVPFLLEGVGGHTQYMLPDMVHPRADAQPIIVNNVWPHLKTLLD